MKKERTEATMFALQEAGILSQNRISAQWVLAKPETKEAILAALEQLPEANCDTAENGEKTHSWGDTGTLPVSQRKIVYDAMVSLSGQNEEFASHWGNAKLQFTQGLQKVMAAYMVKDLPPSLAGIANLFAGLGS